MSLVFLQFGLQSFIFLIHLFQQLLEWIPTLSQRHPVILQPLCQKKNTWVGCSCRSPEHGYGVQVMSPARPVLPSSSPLPCVSGRQGLGRCAARTPWCWRAPSECWAPQWSSPPAAAPSPGPAADAATLHGDKSICLSDMFLRVAVFYWGASVLLTCSQSSGGAFWLDHLRLLTDQYLLHVLQLTGRHCIHLT